MEFLVSVDSFREVKNVRTNQRLLRYYGAWLFLCYMYSQLIF